MKITLPLPARGLSPNARYHWRAKGRLTKRARWLAKVRTAEAIAAASAPPAVSGYSLAFFYPDRRHRDDDNAQASTKAYRDGIADALGIDDHAIRLASVPTFATDPANPRLEITLHP